jgi:ABC-type polar amino acid transport system ATPase subunit
VAFTSLHVAGYRSVREVRLKMSQVSVLLGPNGCGRTDLYRAVYLLTAAASSPAGWGAEERASHTRRGAAGRQDDPVLAGCPLERITVRTVVTG